MELKKMTKKEVEKRAEELVVEIMDRVRKNAKIRLLSLDMRQDELCKAKGIDSVWFSTVLTSKSPKLKTLLMLAIVEETSIENLLRPFDVFD